MDHTLCFFLSVAVLSLPTVLPLGDGKRCKEPLVEITVSPLVNKKEVRMLDLEWDVEDWRTGDWVSLYRGDPRAGGLILFAAPASGSSGWLRTDRQEGRIFADPIYKPTCSQYWAAYWRQNQSQPVATSCLGTKPRWMEENREKIKRLQLRDVFLPGTHDSASFLLSSSPFKENRYQKYVFTQDESVMEQLIHGARYLDFRIARYKAVYWLNHDIFRVHPLEFPLRDLKNFLKNTQEIVVLDLHRFPVGFKEAKHHDDFVKYLEAELKEYMSPTLGWYSTLDEIWRSGKRLVVAYNDRNTYNTYDHLFWSPVSQKWPNVIELPALQQYFKQIFDYTPRYPWAAMAQLTPTTWTVITDKHKGLRRMADTVNHNVTAWFRGEWGGKCNAVAVDFLRSTGVVEAAIRWNRRKAKGSSCDY